METQLDRIERKLDMLIAALADEGECQPTQSLDGDIGGVAREPGTGLG